METVENSEIDQLFAEQVGSHALRTRQFFCQLMAHSRQGHLCLKSQEQISSDQIAQGSNDLLLPTAPIIHENGRYYLQRNWVLETTILHHIQRLLSASPKLMADALPLPPQLNPRQADVVRHAMSYSLTIVTGGPGTGKTFTAGHIIQALAQSLPTACFRVKIAAPTGKAADRLAQTIRAADHLEIESLTLHRLLSLQPGRNRLFENRKILADLIIVDEASMIDACVFAHLLAAIPSGSRLILLGDADQLPPLMAGEYSPIWLRRSQSLWMHVIGRKMKIFKRFTKPRVLVM